MPLYTTLQFAVDNEMDLHYINRTTYRKKNDPDFLNNILIKFPNVYVIPEGGTNSFAIKGAVEIIDDINIEYTYNCYACGTGGTISGLIVGLGGKKKIIGFPALKGAGFLIDDVTRLVNDYSGKYYSNWEINLDYHFGGYAKIKIELIDFINNFEKQNNIKLDPIYTGKMMYGIYDLIKKGFFEEQDVVIAIHTGGFQGNAGMKPKIEKLLASYSPT